MKTIWNKETGLGLAYESVDAREILANSPDVYTDVDPSAEDARDPDGDGREAAPQNVASVENEFRREPVGDDPPAPERVGTIIRNPVSDVPAMAPRAGSVEGDALTAAMDHDQDGKKGGVADLDAMTVEQLKTHAAKRKIHLDGATTKADIRAAIDKAQK